MVILTIQEQKSSIQDSKDHHLDGPTRRDWKPNNSKFNCYGCNKVFHYLTEKRRKHHCRYCGEIFCSDCLNNYIHLDKDANFALIGNNSIEDEIDDQSPIKNRNTNTTTTLNNNNSNHEKSFGHKYLCEVCTDCFHKYEDFLKVRTQIANPDIEFITQRFNDNSTKDTSQVTNNNNQQRQNNGGRLVNKNNDNNSDKNEYCSGDNTNNITNNNNNNNNNANNNANANGEKKPQTDESGNSNAIPVDWDWSSF
ncbi:hypothetical protein B5S27_g5651 [[Candida] boidinii]|nr:hypothetical protein B5S27_g5651 [[Candida] boidinii]